MSSLKTYKRATKGVFFFKGLHFFFARHFMSSVSESPLKVNGSIGGVDPTRAGARRSGRASRWTWTGTRSVQPSGGDCKWSVRLYFGGFRQKEPVAVGGDTERFPCLKDDVSNRKDLVWCRRGARALAPLGLPRHVTAPRARFKTAEDRLPPKETLGQPADAAFSAPEA